MLFPLSSNQQQQFESFTGWHFMAYSSWVFKEDDTSWKGAYRSKSRPNQLKYGYQFQISCNSKELCDYYMIWGGGSSDRQF
jgi:hypothetical protein